jgi:hypothetical protein
VLTTVRSGHAGTRLQDLCLGRHCGGRCEGDRVGEGAGLLHLLEPPASAAGRPYPVVPAWLVFSPDGNLIVHEQHARVRWASDTAGRGAYARFQIDGNLVVYNDDDGAGWASGTHGYDGSFLAVQDDGNVVIYRADGNALWLPG